VIKTLKQIVTNDVDLNRVQRNVFEFVEQIQSIDFNNFYEVGGVNDIPNATEVLVNGPIFIPEGDYVCTIGAFFEVTYGGNPSQIDAHLNIVKGTEAGDHLLDDRTFTLASDHGSFSSQFVERTFILNSTGSLHQIDCEINVNGGSSVQRNVLDAFIKTARRFI